MFEKKCEFCGKKFNSRQSKIRFCSKSCAIRNRRIDKSKIKCKYCGRPVAIIKKQICRKHDEQLRRFGVVLDCDPRTINDKNDYEIYNSIVLMRLYDKNANLVAIARFNKKHLKKLTKYKWGLDDNGYVRTDINNKRVKMHQIIMGRKKGYEIDHISHNKRDNTDKNLRFVTRSQNNMNRKGVKGYCYDKAKNTWFSYIDINKKRKYLGWFKVEEEAKKARLEAEKQIHGEYSYRVN